MPAPGGTPPRGCHSLERCLQASHTGFSSSPNPPGFAGCGNSAVCKNVCLQSNLAQEQGSREAVAPLSLGTLAICLDTALSCCSCLKAETYPAWSRCWSTDSQGTSLVSVSFLAPGTSMLSAKPLLDINRNLQQEPWSRSRLKTVPPPALACPRLK